MSKLTALLSKAQLALGGAVLLTVSAAGQAITVDGNLSDWGLTFSGQSSDWTTTQSGVLSVVEDQSGDSGAFLSPGWGGQAYDAEAMYMTWNASHLYVAMVTGHNPSTSTGGGSYGRGDFAFDFNLDGTWDFGFATKNRAGGAIAKGSLYSTTNANWAYGLWSSPSVLGPSTDAVALTGGTLAGVGSLFISDVQTNMGALGGNHWIYELAIPVSAFAALWDAQGPNQAFDLTWTMLCGNDILRLDPPVSSVPVPGTAGLALVGMLGLGLRRRSRG
ncbi:MAG: hypothetical protein AB7N69_10030 [Immundisolibacter sp.]|uniref:hypothetical protein n=1 Tax=Immundisolibacter sp. TaxID=1934948 RepID=UPI003D0CF63F